jgi:hypothetical protein
MWKTPQSLLLLKPNESERRHDHEHSATLSLILSSANKVPYLINIRMEVSNVSDTYISFSYSFHASLHWTNTWDCCFQSRQHWSCNGNIPAMWFSVRLMFPYYALTDCTEIVDLQYLRKHYFTLLCLSSHLLTLGVEPDSSFLQAVTFPQLPDLTSSRSIQRSS